MESDQKIWVLGALGTNADEHIEWTRGWPYFGDVDILIINLDSCSEEVLGSLDPDKVSEAKQIIYDRFMHGGTIILITSPRVIKKVKHDTLTNFSLSPIGVRTKYVDEGHDIVYDKEKHPFSPYLKHLKKFNFYLDDYNFSKLHSAGSLFSSASPVYLTDYQITDKAGHDLGQGFSSSRGTGKVIFLPPVNKISTIEGINLIIKQLLKTEDKEKEPSPNWIYKIPITGIQDLEKEIQNIISQKNTLDKKLLDLNEQKQSLLNHYRLLYSKGDGLEDAVLEAFRILHIDNITHGRNENLEDGLLQFREIDNVEYGVIEIKGTENRTSLANLTQSNKWVDDYIGENKTVKGIFIPNQHRLEVYPASRNKKLHFEPNELEYARTREICILPSCVLFEAVNQALDGKAKSREELEKLLFNTNGLLTKL